MTVISQQTQNLLTRYVTLYNSIISHSNVPNGFSGAELITGYIKIMDAAQADAFFEKYGVGNAFFGRHIPFERMIDYELLLEILVSYDPVQYHKIHKGSPYYFIGWTAYQYRDFAKSTFYMDAAVSEDLKIQGVQEKTSMRPSLEFFLLDADSNGSGKDIHEDLKNIVSNALEDYSTNSGSSFTLNDLRTRFASDLLYTGPEERSLLTAFYTFILEYQEKKKQIILRSDTGGSIQPFLDHLFDGARILESLLQKRGSGSGTLYPRIIATSDLGVTQSALQGNKTLAEAEQQHNSLTEAGSSFQDINFAAAYIIRNTTGHSLLWPDQFPNENSYDLLFKSLLNAIFWTIEKLWI
jgi:hypothetical protein